MLFVPGLALPKDVKRSSSRPSQLHVIKPQNPQQRFPENCIATFENTLQHTFAIMEIDLRYTKDGRIVVHHDQKLERTTTGKGPVAELTLRELKKLRLKDTKGLVTEFQIPTLDDVLQWARGKTILVLDKKDVPIEVCVRKIEEHRAQPFAMLIVYSFENARKCYKLNKNIIMEVMIPNRERFYEFDQTDIPWNNIIAFVGHSLPADKALLQMIHAKGTCCMAGTSRNLDREFIVNHASGTAQMEQRYRALLQLGIDVIETDLPKEVGKLLYSESAIPESKSRIFQVLHF
jgi:glycerophosphoryl diester phosphodiesterase